MGIESIEVQTKKDGVVEVGINKTSHYRASFICKEEEQLIKEIKDSIAWSVTKDRWLCNPLFRIRNLDLSRAQTAIQKDLLEKIENHLKEQQKIPVNGKAHFEIRLSASREQIRNYIDEAIESSKKLLIQHVNQGKLQNVGLINNKGNTVAKGSFTAINQGFNVLIAKIINSEVGTGRHFSLLRWKELILGRKQVNKVNNSGIYNL